MVIVGGTDDKVCGHEERWEGLMFSTFQIRSEKELGFLDAKQ